MKKRIRSLVLTLAAAALLVLLPQSNALTVKADGPETYSVAYIEGTYNEWRYQPGSVFDEPKGHGSLGELLLKLKDGDSVVVYQVGTPGKTLDLGSTKLGNLTIYQNVNGAVISTGGVKDCYVLAGALTAVNGDITTAYIYDAPNTAAPNTTTCTFNNNVIDMYLYMTRDPATNISCGGTVGHFHATYVDNGDTYTECYDYQAGKFSFLNGYINVPEWAHGSGPSDEYLQANAAANEGTAQAPSTGKNTSDEYDKVPKTGDSNPVFWLLLASAACFGISCLLRKKESCK